MDCNKFSSRVIAVSVFAFLYTFTRQTFLPAASLIDFPGFNNIDYFFSADNITSLFGLVYACLQIPYGILMDKKGINTMVSFLTGMMTLGLLVSAISPNSMIFALGRLLTVIGCGGAFISSVTISNRDLGVKTTKNFIGLLIGASLLTGIGFIQYIMPFVNNIHNGWRYLYLGKAVIMGAVFSYFVGHTNDDNISCNSKQTKENVSFINCLKQIASNPKMLLILGLSLIFFTIFYSVMETSLLVNFLHNTVGLSIQTMFSILLGGFLAGFATTPTIAHIFKDINYVIFLCIIIGALSMAMIINPTPLLTIIFLSVIGYSNGLQMIMVELANGCVPSKYMAMVVGIMNVIFLGGSFFVQQFLYFIVPRLTMGAGFMFIYIIGVAILSIGMAMALKGEHNKNIDCNDHC